MKTGIYRFTNKINQKNYIGQSFNIEKRYEEHKYNYRHLDNKFYRALRKYGFDSFDFEILELCEMQDLNEKEMFYINYYDSYSNGYNSTLGGYSGSLKVLREEDLKSLIQDLKETQLDYQTLKEKYKISVQAISMINQGKSNIRQNEKYPLREDVNKTVTPRDPKTMIGKLNTNAKAVKATNIKTKEVLYFDTRADAARYLIEQNISKAQNKSIETSIYRSIAGLRKSAYGYVWEDSSE